MSSGIFKWSNDSRYFNPTCDEHVYFDTYNDSTEERFCFNETCILPIFTPTGVEVPCDQVLKPSGYRNRIFKWGIKDASWTLNANYDGFTRNDYAFVEPFQITESETAPSPCLLKVEWWWDWAQRFYNHAFYLNGSGWNDRLKTVYATPAGFTPMEGKELDGMTIDPSIVGAKILRPIQANNPYFCTDQNNYIEAPEIEYFTVGTDQVPSSNTVVLKNAHITASPTWIPEPASNAKPYGIWFRNYVEGYNNFPGSIGVYPVCHQGSPSVTVNYDVYSTDRNDLTAYRNNPYNYDPSIGAFGNGAKISWVKPTGTGGSQLTNLVNNNNMIVTGYRMQKYIQKSHSVKFSYGRPEVTTAVRHLETVVKSFGYKITWEFVSATIEKYVSEPIFNNPNYPITESGSYISHTARGDVTLRMTYTPVIVDKEEYGPYVTSSNLCSPITTTSPAYRGYLFNPPYSQYNKCYSNYNGFLQYLNNIGGRSDGAVNYGLLTSQRSIFYIGLGYTAYDNTWVSQQTALGSGMSSLSVSNPLNPASQSSIVNYEYPLNKQPDPYYNMNLTTVVNGVNIVPQPPQLITSTRNGKLWRTLSGAINPVSNSTIDISFSNRSEWFNPTCPFPLIYDQYESNPEWHPNGCYSTIKPLILPTG